MTTPRRRRLFLALLLLPLLGAGCNLMSLPYFIMGGDDGLPPQLMKLSSDDKDKENKVVILTYAGLVTQAEFVTAERELSGMLSKDLQDAFKENKEKVSLVPTGQVNKYKDNHPNWHTDLEAAGKHFDADYVVYLDVESLNLYEKGSVNLLYRGQADIHVSVIDMHKPDESPAVKDYHSVFPRAAPVPVDDRNAQEFQRAFLNDVAKHLSWFFTSHPPSEEIGLPE